MDERMLWKEVKRVRKEETVKQVKVKDGDRRVLTEKK